MRLTVALILAVPTAAQAAGGPHVVDDSEVEDAGVCHVEAWATRRSPSTAVGFVAPACTPRAVPWLEIGAVASYGPQKDAVAVGPALKATFVHSDKGIGVGLDVGGNWARRSGRFETAQVIVPATLKASDTLDLSVNAGWLYTRTGHTSALFTGAQLMWQPRKTLGLMIEGFDRTDGVPGGQAGVRWTPVERVDLDATVSHGFDGTAHANFTLGAIVRFGRKAA